MYNICVVLFKYISERKIYFSLNLFTAMKPWLRPILTRNHFLLCLFYTCVQNSNLQKIKIAIAGLSFVSFLFTFLLGKKKRYFS